VGLTSFRRAQTQARDGQRKADIGNIRGALEQFYSDNNIYPTAATWETELQGSTGKVYLKKVPKQPDGTTSYPYTGTSQTYCVSVILEINPPAGTPTCDGNNYGLTAQD
ncbi:hypothetical protein IH981_03630, partial [Patescibacteria group bacterium]|nr:hypothetical protein [Patescibacteria group bacterium]